MLAAGYFKMEAVVFTTLLLLLQKMNCKRSGASGHPSKGNVQRRIRTQASAMELCTKRVNG